MDFLWGKMGREWLSEVSLPAVFRFQIDAMTKAIDEHTQLIKAGEEIIKRQVQMTRDALILKRIAGIGDILALTIASEVGDISRFGEPGKLASYAGLVPSTYSSGGRTTNGHITKQGSRYLRWALVEAAIHAWKDDEQLFRIHTRVAARKGRKTARIAVARRLAEIIWHKLMRAGRKISRLQKTQ